MITPKVKLHKNKARKEGAELQTGVYFIILRGANHAKVLQECKI